MKKITSKLSLFAIGGVMLFAAMTIGSCSKSSSGGGGGTHITPLGGYTSSDSVAASNLVAYWPFDGSANEKISGSTATASGISFNAGIRGEAYQGSASGYATLPAPSAFSNLGSYSLSLWYKIPSQPVAGDPQGLFFLSGTTTQNELIYELDVPNTSQIGTDSIKVHHGFTNLGSAGWQGFTMEAFDTTTYSGWIHLVTTYDGGSSTYIIYQDAVPIENGTAFGTSTSSILYQGPLGTPAPALQGDLSWSTDPPVSIILGTWPAGLYGVSPTLGSNGCFLGQMDELRIFNRALTQQEVAGLYLNGKAGR